MEKFIELCEDHTLILNFSDLYYYEMCISIVKGERRASSGIDWGGYHRGFYWERSEKYGSGENKLKFPKSIQVVYRKFNRYYREEGRTPKEIVVTVEWGLLRLIYFKENVLIELPDPNNDTLREEIAKMLGGEVIGDNKFISVKRKDKDYV